MNHARFHRPVVLVLLLGCGCQTPEPAESDHARDLEQRRTEAFQKFSQSAAVRDTIGAYAWLEGLLRLRVRGYGLVVGLGENGSRQCPDRIRKRLSAEIRKNYGLGDSRQGLDAITPEAMIDSRDTAVVLVEGEIGAARLRGTRFDLTVTALPGTDTTSLAGGRLYGCDLRYYRQAGGDMVQEGKILAKGAGPVFINPFGRQADSATPANLRRGRIIGGGTSMEDRSVRLVLSSPQYARATQIQNRINDRFGRGTKIASAETPSHVALDIPREFFGEELDFLAVVRHLQLSTDPGAEEQRTRSLTAELLDPEAPHDSIGLALEGIGKTVRPVVRNLYDSRLPHVRYYAARTGLRLGDSLAIPVLRQEALVAAGPYQLDAIRDLGHATQMSRAAVALADVLRADLPDRARTLAYDGLIRHQAPTLNSTPLDQMILDHVPDAAGPPMIYATVSEQARILVLGDVPCRTPLFYRHPSGLVTLRADSGSTEVSVLRTLPSGRVSPTASTSPDLCKLVSTLGGEAGQDRFGRIRLGLSYAQVLDVIAGLCENDTLPAQFRLERPEAVDVQPMVRSGRPDSEL